MYQPGELIDAVNMVPDPEGGGVATRLGDVLLGTLSGRVHSLYTTYTAAGVQVQYQGAGTTLYRNYVPIVAALLDAPITFASMAGFGEQHVYTFFAGGQEALRLKDDGITLTNWGLRSPTTAAVGTPAFPPGQLAGFYAWKQIFVRKPVISGGVFGRWVDATQTYTLTGTPPFLLGDGTTNSGTVFGAPKIWGEIVLTLTSGTSTSTGQIDMAYWNGLGWAPVGFGPLDNLSPTLTYLRMDADTNNWVPVNGLYLFRVRVTTNPLVMPEIQGAVFYDTVYTARSNPSPAGTVSGPYAPAPGDSAATVPLANPLTGLDLDLQATHVALYRTTGDDAAAQTAGELAGPAALYFFEQDYPAGTTEPHVSLMPDTALGELLEIDNDRPPAFDTITEYQERIFGARGNRVSFSKRGFPEAFPATNFVEVGALADPIARVAQFHGILYIWTRARVYLLQGADELTYTTRLVQGPTGLGAVQSVAEGEKAVYFLGTDGDLWALEGTIAHNISHLGHHQFFDGVTLHGVAGISKAARGACVGQWGRSRYRLSYPEAPATLPTASLMVDEARGSWWRDSRAWHALWYDRQADTWYGGLSDGSVLQLDSGTTDHGAPVVGTMQTLDDDAGRADSDKDLSQLVVETMTSAAGLTVTPVVAYDLAATPLGTVVSLTWGQVILPTPAPGTYRGVTLGYVLAGPAPWALYALLPNVLRLPQRLRAWETLATTLSHAGPKILDSLLLDVDLVSGTLSWQLYGDSLLAESGMIEVLGHRLVQLLTARHEATVFQLVLRGTGRFLLYEGSVLAVRPLPPPVYTDIMVPTDLGTLQDKIGLGYALDIELLSPGTVTTTFHADGVLIHTLMESRLGRQRTERFRLPSTMHGRLFEIRRESTAPYRLWPGTDFGFQIVGTTQEQHYRPVQEPYGATQRLPLLQLPHSEEV